MVVKKSSGKMWRWNCSGVSQVFKDFAVGAGEGEDGDEYLITRVETFFPALNIVNCYGEQRTSTIEKVEEKWKRMLKEMEEIRAKGEFCLLTGDLNKLVGNDELGVPGNNSEVSPGGRLLRSLLATKDWILVNGMDKEVVKGGPFTRKDPASGKLSCLDLFVISKELRPYVSSLLIDSKKEMAVARAVKQVGKPRLIYSDHFSCLLTLENLPRRQTKSEETRKAV